MLEPLSSPVKGEPPTWSACITEPINVAVVWLLALVLKNLIAAVSVKFAVVCPLNSVVLFKLITPVVVLNNTGSTLPIAALIDAFEIIADAETCTFVCVLVTLTLELLESTVTFANVDCTTIFAVAILSP